MHSLDPDMFSNHKAVLFDQVGVDATTILCSLIAELLRKNNSIHLVSYKDTFQKFKLLLRKLGVLDLTVLEAQGKFKFATRFDNSCQIDSKAIMMIHGGSFADLNDLMDAMCRSKVIIHIHKDIDERLWRYAARQSHLVLDLQPLSSGFSQHIFGHLEVYPGGLYHPSQLTLRQYNVNVTDNSVALVDCCNN